MTSASGTTGGIAAMHAALAYVVGMVGFLLVAPLPDDPARQLAVLVTDRVSKHLLRVIV